MGGQGAVWLLTALAIGTQFEFYTLLEKKGQRPFKHFGTTLGAIMILAPYYANRFSDAHAQGMAAGIVAVTIVACCLRILAHRNTSERIETLEATLVGLIYIPFMLTFMVRLLELPSHDTTLSFKEADTQGIMMILWFVVVTKFCDVGALLVGRAFGRHQMSPNTSPKKTWEGAVGGCLTSVLLGFALTYFARDYFPVNFTPFWGALIALPMAIISIISDLVESMFKRQAAEKDSGSFIPGIGGAFDLTDSFILTAPTAFLLIRLIV